MVKQLERGRVMEEYGYTSKTEAVEMVLRHLDRKARFHELGRRGLEMSPEEMGASVDANYDINAIRVAATPPPYGN